MDSLQTTILPWLGTYAVHSTALLGAVWLLVRTLPRESNRAQEWLWRAALLGPLATATLQAGLPIDPALGKYWLPDPASWTELASASEVEHRSAEELNRGPELLREESAGTAWTLEEELPLRTLAFETPGNPTFLPREEPLPIGSAHIAKDKPVRARPVQEPDGPTPNRFAASWLPAENFSTSHALAQAETPWLSEDEGFSDFAAKGTTGKVAAPANATGPSPLFALLRWSNVLLALWCLGGLLGLLVLAFAWRRLMDRMAGREEIRSGPLVEILQDLCDRAGRKRRPRLCLSPKLGSPATVGIWRSQICVPTLAVTDLPSAQQRAMLGHELAHILRRDPLWFFLYRLVERVLFFQPLNRVARKQIQELAEYQCDDWAAGQMDHGLDLAQCLTEVASWMLREKPQLALLPMAGQGSLLGHRVRRLLDAESRAACQRRRLWTLPLAGGLLAGAAFGLPSFAALKPAVEDERSETAAASVAPLPKVETVWDRAPERSPSLTASEVASSDPLDTQASSNLDLDPFRSELDDLEAMIAEIEAQAAAAGKQERYAAALQAIRKQVQSLRTKQKRLQELIDKLP